LLRIRRESIRRARGAICLSLFLRKNEPPGRHSRNHKKEILKTDRNFRGEQAFSPSLVGKAPDRKDEKLISKR